MSSYPFFCPLCSEDVTEDSSVATVNFENGENWEVHDGCMRDVLGV